jgi:hypothetical protein
MNKKIAILQSNYIPWKGYFDIIHSVDEFVLYDEAQYTTNDWRNRNRIKRPDGELAWITIPVRTRNHFDQTISQTTVADPLWARRHWDKLRNCYGSAPYFHLLEAKLRGLYEALSKEVFLSVINYRLIQCICDVLRISTKISWSTDYPGGYGKTGRLISICESAGAGTYLSGPAGRNYIDQSEFERHGIKLEWKEYRYPEYPQPAGAFAHQVSILDLLFNAGPEAPNYIWGFREARVA